MVALVALAAGGGLADLWRAPLPARIPLALPGAWLVVQAAPPAPALWVDLLLMGWVGVGSALMADFDRRWRHLGLGPVLLALSAAGVFATVPDTETALPVLGAAVPLALLGWWRWPRWPGPLGALGGAGSAVATGVLAAAVAGGVAGRGSALVGGLACLGLFAVEPLARRLHPGRKGALAVLRPRPWWGPLPAVAAHGVLVLMASRVAAHQASAGGAAAVATGVLGTALVALATWGAVGGGRHAGAGTGRAVTARSPGRVASRSGPGEEAEP
jgi:hypothetical protein